MSKLLVSRVYWLIVRKGASDREQCRPFQATSTDDAFDIAQRMGYTPITLHMVC